MSMIHGHDPQSEKGILTPKPLAPVGLQNAVQLQFRLSALPSSAQCGAEVGAWSRCTKQKRTTGSACPFLITILGKSLNARTGMPFGASIIHVILETGPSQITCGRCHRPSFSAQPASDRSASHLRKASLVTYCGGINGTVSRGYSPPRMLANRSGKG